MTVDLTTIPGTGFKVSRTILGEVQSVLHAYKVRPSAAYAPAGVGGHAENGDHPKGLAVDLVPDTSRGGTWRDVDALAAAAEPTQNHPADGFRWVGYNGDAGHGDPAHAGPNAHLHLSFDDPGSGGKSLIGKIISAPLDALKAAGDASQQAGADAAKRGDAGVNSALHDIGGVAGTVFPTAGDIADTLVGKATDAIGKDLLRWTLYAALVIGGMGLVLAGGARVAGVGTHS